MFSLSDPITKLHLVNAASQKALQRLGINTIQDLLYYFPRDWQDLSHLKTVAEIRPNEPINIRAKVKKLKQERTRWRRKHLTSALLEDQSGNVLAVWFNQPYLKHQLLPGREYFFTGKGKIYEQTLQLQNPAFELVKEETVHTAGIIPLYELTEGLTQKQLRYWLKQALGASNQIPEHLPAELLKRLRFLGLSEALKAIHFPPDQDRLKQARRRLAFDELFLHQLAFLSYKKKLKSYPAPPLTFDQRLIKGFVDSLPFKLTHSQRATAWEILQDLEHGYPMNRLLEGDVGSGKTVVAGIAMLQAAARGWQSVLLAPTEILALQHYQTLKELFRRHEVELALLTRSHKLQTSHNPSPPPLTLRGGVPPLRVRGGQGELLENIANGKIKIIIGTHALLQETFKFQRIGLLVVDEQHRFGVRQRAKLLSTEHGVVPHLLSMSATPIPRTLALAFYGDLDISRLTELPKGRKKIITNLVEPEARQSAYEFIRKEIKNGRQVYVVVPLIGDDSDNLSLDPSPDLGREVPFSRRGEGGPIRRRRRGPGEVERKSIITEAEKLKKIFPEFQIATLHGRMRGEEKKQIMEDFKSGKINILVSTTVIEVGVDVPNATIMLIENAERFGLATLHQLRGRVGRSDIQSYCFLFTENNSLSASKRLNALSRLHDGFELAELDLKLRGPGEFLGTRQHGYIPFRIASLQNKTLIKQAREAAEALLKTDPKLADFPLLFD